ncbi:MAG: hypothetical protein ACLTDR_08855 [Adlercreutzia equolifaciens]
MQTPMVHWPDSMVTYDEYDQILFSNDAFGQHYASSKRFTMTRWGCRKCSILKSASTTPTSSCPTAECDISGALGITPSDMVFGRDIVWRNHAGDHRRMCEVGNDIPKVRARGLIHVAAEARAEYRIPSRWALRAARSED